MRWRHWYGGYYVQSLTSSKSQSQIQILEFFLQSKYSNLASSKADLVGSKSTKNLFSINIF